MKLERKISICLILNHGESVLFDSVEDYSENKVHSGFNSNQTSSGLALNLRNIASLKINLS